MRTFSDQQVMSREEARSMLLEMIIELGVAATTLECSQWAVPGLNPGQLRRDLIRLAAAVQRGWCDAPTSAVWAVQRKGVG